MFESSGIHIIPTPLKAPSANAYTERWVRTVRHACLDQIMIFNESHLRRALEEYLVYYNRRRPHQELGQQSPIPRVKPMTIGAVNKRQVLGGIVNDYFRATETASISPAYSSKKLKDPFPSLVMGGLGTAVVGKSAFSIEVWMDEQEEHQTFIRFGLSVDYQSANARKHFHSIINDAIRVFAYNANLALALLPPGGLCFLHMPYISYYSLIFYPLKNPRPFH